MYLKLKKRDVYLFGQYYAVNAFNVKLSLKEKLLFLVTGCLLRLRERFIMPKRNNLSLNLAYTVPQEPAAFDRS